MLPAEEADSLLVRLLDLSRDWTSHRWYNNNGVEGRTHARSHVYRLGQDSAASDPADGQTQADVDSGLAQGPDAARDASDADVLFGTAALGGHAQQPPKELLGIIQRVAQNVRRYGVACSQAFSRGTSVRSCIDTYVPTYHTSTTQTSASSGPSRATCKLDST